MHNEIILGCASKSLDSDCSDCWGKGGNGISVFTATCTRVFFFQSMVCWDNKIAEKIMTHERLNVVVVGLSLSVGFLVFEKGVYLKLPEAGKRFTWQERDICLFRGPLAPLRKGSHRKL